MFLGSGPGGLHLNLESSIKTIFDSYSCGKENFGFDRDFIIEVLNTCPSNSCRLYKGQQPFDQQHQNFQPPMNMNTMEYGISPTRSPLLMQPPVPVDPSKMNRPLTNQQITQQIIQQQQSRMNHQSISMESLEKQRVMQQLDKKHYETVAAIVQANNNLGLPNQMNINTANMMPQVPLNHNHNKTMDYSR